MPEYEDFHLIFSSIKSGKDITKNKSLNYSWYFNSLIVMSSDHKNKHWGNEVWWHKWIQKAINYTLNLLLIPLDLGVTWVICSSSLIINLSVPVLEKSLLID